MALIVEDGTGKTDADAYISVADVTAYNTAHEINAAWAAAADAAKEKAIRLATQYLDLAYQSVWRGTRYNETQALAWPRTEFYDPDGFAIAAETVPLVLAQACAELAIRSVVGDTFLAVIENPGLTSHSFANQTESESKTWAGGSRAMLSRLYPRVGALLRKITHTGPLVERC